MRSEARIAIGAQSERRRLLGATHGLLPCILMVAGCSVPLSPHRMAKVAVVSDAKRPKPPLGPTRFQRRESGGAHYYAFHRMDNGQLFLTDGRAIARVEGERLLWEPELCRGLPVQWSPQLFYGIESLSGDSAPTWLTLRLDCAPPSWAGTPLPFEFARTSRGWTVVPDEQRRLWRGDIHYSAAIGEGFLWQGEERRLLLPDEPGVGVDGYLSPAELAETSTCLGRSLIVDEQYRPQDEPSLPRDLCVDKATVVAGTLFILGRDAQGRLVLERRPGAQPSRADAASDVASASVRFALPWAAERCSLFSSDVAMMVEAVDRVLLAGSDQCTDENSPSGSDFELLFDGAGFVPTTLEWPAELPPEESPRPAARLSAQRLARELSDRQHSFIIVGEQLYERSRGTWVPITLPRDERDEEFLGPTLPLEIIEASDGTVWVTAGADGGGCMTAGRWQPRLLYSTVSFTMAAPASPQSRGQCAQRMLEAEHCHSFPGMTVLATRDLEHRFSKQEANALAVRNRVPPSCEVAEFRTPNERALVVSPRDPWEEALPGSCSSFVESAKLPRWCFDRQQYLDMGAEDAVDSAFQWSVLIEGAE